MLCSLGRIKVCVVCCDFVYSATLAAATRTTTRVWAPCGALLAAPLVFARSADTPFREKPAQGSASKCQQFSPQASRFAFLPELSDSRAGSVCFPSQDRAIAKHSFVPPSLLADLAGNQSDCLSRFQPSLITDYDVPR